MKCCLCGGDAGCYGHNPDPLKPESVTRGYRCCDTCNTTKVIPARIKAMGLRF